MSAPLSDGSDSPLSDAGREVVARCLAASGMLVAPDSIVKVSNDGLAVHFDDRAVWVQPATARAIREGLCCAVCGAGPTGRCDPPDDYEGECPHGCSPER
jgi:hypothetical protein